MLDTNVLLAAILSKKGASRQIVTDGLDGRFIWSCSVALMFEYEAVLQRPEHLAKAGLLPNDIDRLLDTVAAIVEQVRLSFLWRPVLQDPNDEMVLETAVNGRVDLVVTMNLRHLALGLKRFGIPAMTPGPALRLMRQSIQNYE